MQTTFLGRTGVRISRLVFGTMTLGGEADREASAALYARCREAGINSFDTADIYNGGASEEILGELMSGHRDELIIASKAYFPTSSAPTARGGSRFHVVRACEASLRRLRTDRIDLYYLHRFDDEADLEEQLRGLEHLVLSGKILYPALSNFAAWQVAKSLGVQARMGWAPVAAIQPMYNLVKRQAEVEILPMAKSEGLAVFPYSPLGGGLLTGKFGASDRPEGARLTSWPMYKERYGAALNYEVAERFRALARELGHDPTSLAIAWVASHPAVTAPILGARSVAQLEPALRALDIDMTPELRARVSECSPEPPPATDRNEEGKVSPGIGGPARR